MGVLLLALTFSLQEGEPYGHLVQERCDMMESLEMLWEMFENLEMQTQGSSLSLFPLHFKMDL